ncbi:hydrogenase expression/formation protein HypE [Helicobacter sp. MIT 14-3879]|uniref:hydrogenase expression/formation protein HypE n=1 Tax=Helicobacter sp. MIT 14-3879 TaxID=2040649 RepID=UPI000E1F5AD4|nr:hydrogenase expression/formation protein HypE [Helicobacter sp. MIT 14-3879]RDU64797.1 hydrogenase expression/formation protein HypE [Helicobacter sp. MIT 14-3879]
MLSKVLLSYGNGGLENQELIKIFLKYFDNQYGSEDAGLFSGDNFAISTDAFTITPIFFPGGDIGKLSVCGSCNDVAVMGAKPKYLTISFIIEEGFLISDLERIAKSISIEMKANNITLLSADTKVVSKGAVEGIFITTTVIGEIKYKGISSMNLKENDVIIVSGDIGSHGACLYCLRNNISLENSLHSDCASLWGLVESLLNENIKIHSIRDATRGGIASVLNEWANSSNCDILLDEDSIPMKDEVRGVCEILGIEAYSLANEGVCVFAIPESFAILALEILHKQPLGKNAAIIGKVIKNGNKRVVLNTNLGSKRYLEYPQGEILPRIC